MFDLTKIPAFGLIWRSCIPTVLAVITKQACLLIHHSSVYVHNNLILQNYFHPPPLYIGDFFSKHFHSHAWCSKELLGKQKLFKLNCESYENKGSEEKAAKEQSKLRGPLLIIIDTHDKYFQSPAPYVCQHFIVHHMSL